MEHLLTNITGLDMALGLALLLVYVWGTPSAHHPVKGLDTGAVD